MYASYQTALTQACATSLDPALDDFEVTFAPVPPPPDDTWLSILLDVVTLVGTVAVANFFEQRTFLVSWFTLSCLCLYYLCPACAPS